MEVIYEVVIMVKKNSIEVDEDEDIRIKVLIQKKPMFLWF
jgi:hypothetical protein